MRRKRILLSVSQGDGAPSLEVLMKGCKRSFICEVCQKFGDPAMHTVV